ncbi:MAG: YgcG family protein [Rhodopseudomonas palustris]|nr:MAG: YgcG family protein [Rhodopseudomonas palustris]
MSVVRSTMLALLLGFTMIVAALAQVAVPPLSGRVVDTTGTLDPSVVARLEQKLKAFETRKGSQIAVLLLPSTAPESIEQFSLRVAEAWKIGRKAIDDGAILLVAKTDRKLRIEVGYGIEGALNDVTAKRIIDEIITPRFKAGDFAGGIEAGVDRMISVIDGEPLPVPKPQQEWQHGVSFDFDLLIPLLFGALVFNSVLQAIFGRLLAALLTGAGFGIAFWLLAQSLLIGAIAGVIGFLVALVIDLGNWSGGGGTWSSGRSSGGWSGGSSSSSSGGFSGGGGSFGGGGASGSW